MRVCLDTNVLVSAFVGRGLCADVLRVVLARYDLVLGATVLGELDRVLRAKMGVPEAVVADALDLLRAEAAEVVAEALEPVEGLDIEDGRVVAEAVAGRADMLITGDQTLLRADAMPVLVLSPRGFWERSRQADVTARLDRVYAQEPSASTHRFDGPRRDRCTSRSRVEVDRSDAQRGRSCLEPSAYSTARRTSTSGCSAVRPVPCRICCRQLTPVAATSASSGAPSTAGKSRCPPMVMDRS